MGVGANYDDSKKKLSLFSVPGLEYKKKCHRSTLFRCMYSCYIFSYLTRSMQCVSEHEKKVVNVLTEPKFA
jgi:hypothetical protein